MDLTRGVFLYLALGIVAFCKHCNTQSAFPRTIDIAMADFKLYNNSLRS